MKESLLSLVKSLKADKRIKSYDEAATKQIIILRVLSLLGWDIYNYDEVEPEHVVEKTKVDYLLKYASRAQVFIEVKRIGEPLDRHQEQLLKYSFKEGVTLAILSNGVTWWFYLPLLTGSWEQRKFFSIDVNDQTPEEIASRLIDYLSRDNVVTGKAVENAKAVHNTRQREYEISKTLPKAWQKMIAEPDISLIELISDNTEKMCGFRPENIIVKNFISSFLITNLDEVPRVRNIESFEGIRNTEVITPETRTLEYIIRNANPQLKDLINELRQAVFGLGDNVREVIGAWYIDYRKSSTFMTLVPQTKKNRILIYIKMGDKKIDDPQKWASAIPESFGYGKLNTQFEITNLDQIDYALQLIKQAYDFVP
jgi:hypothetical protein